VGIHRLLHSSCRILNTVTAITRQLIRTARTLEAEWLASLRKAWVQGQRKMSQVLGTFGAAGFRHVTARSRLARVLKLMDRLFL